MENTMINQPSSPGAGSTDSGPPAADEPRTQCPASTIDASPAGEAATESFDEALGQQLDQHLEALSSGRETPPGDTALEQDLSRLRPVVEQLHFLALSLAPGEAGADNAKPPDTRDPLLDDRTPSTWQPETAAAAVLPAGRRIGKYEVIRKLGGGGQAGAYLAFDPDLRRHVVIKLYHQAHTAREQETILREGQALARVRSPYVAQCYSAERHEGVPYLVVEYIPGKDLAKIGRDGRLPLARALELVRQVAEGLAAVHACGLLHRDLKPANILVGDDGLPRLVDFGLAVPVAGEVIRGVSGTLAFMATEQARGEVERIDVRSDLFGLGAVLYDLVTGRPPYQGPDQLALWQAARAGRVTPPREHNPALPASVNDLCMRCLARDPADRFASAGDLVRAIQRCQRLRFWTGQALAERWGRRNFLLAAGATAALLVLVPLAVWLWNRSDGPNQVSRAEDKKPKPRRGVRPQEGPRDPRYPEGRRLRQDFLIEVRVKGAKPDADGVYHLREGKRVQFQVRVPRAAYVGLWHWDDERKIIQYFPSRKYPDHLIQADEWRTIPNSQASFEATPSKRQEYVHVVASTRPWDPPTRGIPTRSPDGQDAYLQLPRKDVEDTVRGLKLVEDARVSEVVVPFQVQPKRK
jgi:hypothetical protein